MTESTTVGSSEKVARILSTEWFVDGQLMNLSLLEKEISADDVLIKVRTQLLNMTTVEQLTLYKSDESIVQE